MSGLSPLAEVDYSVIERRAMAWYCEQWPLLSIIDLHLLPRSEAYAYAYGGFELLQRAIDEEGSGAFFAAAIYG